VAPLPPDVDGLPTGLQAPSSQFAMLVIRGRGDPSDVGRHPRDGGQPVFRM